MTEVVAILGVASNKLAMFVAEQGRLLGGLRQEVQLIGDELGHMKAFLEKLADFNQDGDPQLTEWIRQVRLVSCDIEDIIDHFMHLFAGGNHQWITLAPLRNFPARHQLASQLQKIKARVRNISEARLRYESYYASVAGQVLGRRVQHNEWRHNKDDDALLVEEAHLVGIEKPKIHLISHLFRHSDPSQLKVIAVLGMGGLGKTTLARKVYDDLAVKSHFQIRAWMTVSQNCNFRSLLKCFIQELLSQFKEPIPPFMDSMDTYQLKALAKNFLRRGRYAIVLDDVWETDFWESFKFVLPENNYGGNRIIFTTRIASVASASTVGSQGNYVYKMRCLDYKDSWTLFCKKIFKGSHCPQHLTTTAQSILVKCGGLPLAVLAIGGLLATKDTSRKNEWELVQHRLRNEFESTGKLERVKMILSLSYDDLPSNLKACLLYTSIYPRGHNISSRHLINLLEAEGLATRNPGQTGWDCVSELANRSLIQLREVRCNGLYNFVDIHDLLREFIASKSREKKMATMISTAEQMSEWQSSEVVRRIVFDHNLPEILNPKCNNYASDFRSIINFGRKKLASKAIVSKLLTSSLLTVLELRGIDLEEIPEQVFKLFHLRFLGISGKSITTVPKSIKRLQNLQFLILAETSIKEMPAEIQKLRKLRHLLLFQQAADSLNGHLRINGFKPPCGMGELMELEELHIIDVGQSERNGIVNEIGKLAKLRKLWITNLRTEDGKQLCASLEKLIHVEELVVASLVDKNEVVLLDLNHPISTSSLQSLCWLNLFGGLQKMPPWISNLQGLERITLSSSNLYDDPLESLECLPNLFQLWLNKAYQGERLCFKGGCFSKLKILSLRNMEKLKCVMVEHGAMPSIIQLEIVELPLLEELPLGIEKLEQLQELSLWAVNSQLINKLESEENSQNHQKISHIPQVTIGSLVNEQWKSHQLSRENKAQANMVINDVEPAEIVVGFGTLVES